MQIKLNLIPEYKKEEIKKAYRLRLVSKWEAELLLILILFGATLVSMDYILKINLSAITSGAAQSAQDNSQYSVLAKYDNEIKDMNALVSDIGKVQGSQLYWSNFLEKLDSKIPSGVSIDNLSTKNYAVSLGGRADTRDNLLVFRDSLTNEDCFTNVDLPLSDLVSKENVDFSIDFQVKKECLK